jgi:hypothetical protein
VLGRRRRTDATRVLTAVNLTRFLRGKLSSDRQARVATSEGRLFDDAHVDRTANGEMVRSKSEVIVANTLRFLSVHYLYEEPLTMPDGSMRLPRLHHQ